MRVLITGGAGFIGSNLARQLCSLGKYKIRIFDNLKTGKTDNFKDVSNKVEFVEGDILDKPELEKAMKDVDCVFHMAALASVEESFINTIDYHLVNAFGTLNVLEAAKHAKVKRLVYSSSASVYGNTEKCPVSETFPVDPLSPYALQKYSGEKYAIYFTQHYGFETICLRYFNVYGPFQQKNGGYAGVIFRFFSDGIEKSVLSVEGEGKQTRDFIFVEDVVRANVLAMNADKKFCGDVYNVGTGAEISINDLAKNVVSILGNKIDINHVSPRKGDIFRSCADVSKINSCFGFKSSVGLREGLTKTYEWIKNTL